MFDIIPFNNIVYVIGTALHSACRANHVLVAKQLLDANAPVDVLADTDFTPLHLATQGGHVELVKLLLEFGADPDMASRYERRSAVTLAIMNGWEQVLSALLTGIIIQ